MTNNDRYHPFSLSSGSLEAVAVTQIYPRPTVFSNTLSLETRRNVVLGVPTKRLNLRPVKPGSARLTTRKKVTSRRNSFHCPR